MMRATPGTWLRPLAAWACAAGIQVGRGGGAEWAVMTTETASTPGRAKRLDRGLGLSAGGFASASRTWPGSISSTNRTVCALDRQRPHHARTDDIAAAHRIGP